MQLSDAARSARTPIVPGLTPFARTLGALLVITAPVLGGVLPDDRADVMWHYYNGGDITVEGPELLVQKKVGDSLVLTAGYYEDMISSASIDVKLSASPYHEVRKQENAGIEYQHGKTTYNIGYIHSREPDYIADTTFYSLSQDMFGDLTTVTLGYKRAWDQIFRDIKVNGIIVNDPTFFQRADHRGYSVSVTQIVTRNLMLGINWELLTDQGYLANPYRKIRYASPGQGEGFTLADQVYPNTRTSNAESVQAKYYLPYRAAITASYRYYTDTWDIRAHTFELDYTQPAWHHWIFDTSVRFYEQTHASFYSDLFPRADYSNFMARDRELAAFHSVDFGAGVSYEFQVPGAPWVSKSTANIRADHLTVDYSDFRNALLAGIYGAGKEPLYVLNANIFQVFVSIWY
jgi:hypothetical protein